MAMTPAQHARLMALFDQACELSRADARAFLDALTPSDHELRSPLAAMLDVDRRSQVFFDETRGGAAVLARDILRSALTPGPHAQPAQPVDTLPTSIGDYQVLGRIGSGGMGTVYRAQQQQPSRVVALKTLHPWLVSPGALERFAFESQALAALKHPSIPPVFTVGQHEGTVYFAMELVSGPTLTTWAQTTSPSLHTRIDLLRRIAEAVHHAHLRGFVHRDLKPDNIRIGDDGVPRVLDFGISAALGERSAEVSGTPAYMSPEQVDIGATVDVRSDVFSLGVIAFELLTGRLPAVPAKSGLATLQALKKEPAPRLLSVHPGLGAELDCLVARALAVDVEARYPSAADFAADLERWLTHQPVRAHPPTAWYLTRKFVRRNRLAVVAVGAVMLALAIGGLVSLVLFQRAQDARLAAERARDLATAESARAQATLDFLSTVFASADPERAAGRDATIGQALDRAAKELDAKKVEPRIEAAVRASLAETYMGLGEWIPADTQANAALEGYEKAKLPDDELLARVYELASQVRHEAGRSEGAWAASARAIEVERHLHGDQPHTHVGYALHVHAVGLREGGRLEEALEFHRRGIDVERALAATTGITEDLADALNQYAVSLVMLGRYADAEPNYREALAMDLKQFGPRHHEVATDYHHLAWLENERGNPHAALGFLNQALDIRLATIGKDHTRVGIQRNLEAMVQLELGNLAAADAASDECLRIAEKAFGKNHPRYTRMQQTQVLIRVAQGRAAEAVAIGRRILDFHVARYGPRHWATEGSRSDYAVALLAAGQRAQAITELTEVVDVFSTQLGELPKATRDARARLAQALETQR